jgi:hypothetical protein
MSMGQSSYSYQTVALGGPAAEFLLAFQNQKQGQQGYRIALQAHSLSSPFHDIIHNLIQVPLLILQQSLPSLIRILQKIMAQCDPLSRADCGALDMSPALEDKEIEIHVKVSSILNVYIYLKLFMKRTDTG